MEIIIFCFGEILLAKNISWNNTSILQNSEKKKDFNQNALMNLEMKSNT